MNLRKFVVKNSLESIFFGLRVYSKHFIVICEESTDLFLLLFLLKLLTSLRVWRRDERSDDVIVKVYILDLRVLLVIHLKLLCLGV